MINLFRPTISPERRAFLHAVFIPILLSLLMILVFVLEKGMDWDFYRAGVFPRNGDGIWGVFSMIFIHADWVHLTNNVLSFFVLSSGLYYFYKTIATRVFLVLYLLSGLLLWLIGRENWHIGASGLIYSLAFFLFFSGIFRKHVPLIAISFFVAFVYGSMVWYVVPWKVYAQMSWEGHLAGAVSGFSVALFSSSYGPQKPVVEWDEPDDEDEPEWEEEVDEDENPDAAR